MAKTERYFLSANGYAGFVSYFDRIEKEVGKLYVIKGGPGCGKSGFMKKIGGICADNGLDIEYIHCTGDPESVDCLIIPKLGCAFADGTYPHVIEPPMAGCGGHYVNLSEFCKFKDCPELSTELMHLETERKRCMRRAMSLTAAAGKVCEGVFDRLHTEKAIKGAEKRASGISGREFKKQDRKGTEKVRFLSAFTYKGLITMEETVQNQCGRLYLIDDDLGLGEYMLKVIAEKAADCGYDTVICLSPLEPSKPEAILVPGVFAAFICGEATEKFEEPYRHIRLDASVDRDLLAEEKKRIKNAVKLKKNALAEAADCLKDAKHLHDRIEQIYNPYIDFDGVYALAEEYAQKILTGQNNM